MLFVDASVTVAILAGEPGHAELLDRLRIASSPLWSPLACWEAVSALQSSYKRPVEAARRAVVTFGKQFELTMVTIGPVELTVALDAYQTYGRGRHPARLNFGDCFAYACAKTNGARLLYKGDDFVHTDLA